MSIVFVMSSLAGVVAPQEAQGVGVAAGKRPRPASNGGVWKLALFLWDDGAYAAFANLLLQWRTRWHRVSWRPLEVAAARTRARINGCQRVTRKRFLWEAGVVPGTIYPRACVHVGDVGGVESGGGAFVNLNFCEAKPLLKRSRGG